MAPFIVEGYSNYEFDPWTAEAPRRQAWSRGRQVTRHSVDIKNPPLFITDLLKQRLRSCPGAVVKVFQSPNKLVYRSILYS